MSGPAPTVTLWRFMSKVVERGDCWIWTGAVGSTGYPTFNPSPGVKTSAARWLHEQVTGSRVDDGIRVRWLCADVTCVRPSHLSTDRFWAQVIEDGDCWIWTGTTIKGGYGRFNTTLAHRWAYRELRDTIPDGLGLDHLCRNPPCVNPWHLEPVTQQENNRRKPTHQSNATTLIGATR